MFLFPSLFESAFSPRSKVYDSELNKIKEDPERIQKQAGLAIHTDLELPARKTYCFHASDMRRSPVEVGGLSYYLQVFFTSKVVGLGISEPSVRAG